MILTNCAIIVVVSALVQGADVGCNLNYNLDNYGTCVQNGCCEFSGHETDPALCDGANEVCCYRNDLCPRTGSDFCFRIYGTWVSRYAYHGTPSEVTSGFTTLKNLGITRVYFNVWADGFVYANSNVALANGGVFVRDSLQYAVDAARSLGLEIYAWFEYGTQAYYGTTPANSFAAACDQKDWLLYNLVGSTKVYTTSEGGNYVYCDANNAQVRQFYADFTADIAANYDIDGIQWDDHLSMPNGFDSVDGLPLSTRYQVMEDFTQLIATTTRAAKPGITISYSPSSVSFSQSNHNVDWQNYLLDGVVDEVVPQYYRSTANDYQSIINEDLNRVQGYQSAMLGGIRLSGSSGPTPSFEADRMIEISYEEKMKGVSFWMADDLIESNYVPPNLDYC